VDALPVILWIVGAAGPGVAALVVMNRTGRRWAKARIIVYWICALLYGLNAILLIGDGVSGGVWMSTIICFVAGRGAIRARRAWREGDFRPQAEREREAKGASGSVKAV
jgi:hypothetical protein